MGDAIRGRPVHLGGDVVVIAVIVAIIELERTCSHRQVRFIVCDRVFIFDVIDGLPVCQPAEQLRAVRGVREMDLVQVFGFGDPGVGNLGDVRGGVVDVNEVGRLGGIDREGHPGGSGSVDTADHCLYAEPVIAVQAGWRSGDSCIMCWCKHRR